MAGGEDLRLRVQTMGGMELALSARPQETVRSLKKRLCGLLGVPPAQMRLLVGLTVLSNSKTVAEAGLAEGGALQLVRLEAPETLPPAGAAAGGGIVVLEDLSAGLVEPTDDEVDEYAEWLGMDPEADAPLLWIACEGLRAPLPPAWRLCMTAEQLQFFFNFETGESQWEHPVDQQQRAKYQRLKASRAGEAEPAGRRAPEALPLPGSGAAGPAAAQPPQLPPPGGGRGAAGPAATQPPRLPESPGGGRGAAAQPPQLPAPGGGREAERAGPRSAPWAPEEPRPLGHAGAEEGAGAQLPGGGAGERPPEGQCPRLSLASARLGEPLRGEPPVQGQRTCGGRYAAVRMAAAEAEERWSFDSADLEDAPRPAPGAKGQGGRLRAALRFAERRPSRDSGGPAALAARLWPAAAGAGASAARGEAPAPARRRPRPWATAPAATRRLAVGAWRREAPGDAVLALSDACGGLAAPMLVEGSAGMVVTGLRSPADRP